MAKPEPKWKSWCRLCAKEEPESMVNIKGDNTHIMTGKDDKLTLREALEKYFWVHSLLDDILPKYMCSDCNTLVLSIMRFIERVERVQQMYKFLVINFKAVSFDLQTVRKNFNVSEDNVIRECHSDNQITERNFRNNRKGIKDSSPKECTPRVKRKVKTSESDHSERDDNNDVENVIDDDKEDVARNEQSVSNECEDNTYDSNSEDSMWGVDEETARRKVACVQINQKNRNEPPSVMEEPLERRVVQTRYKKPMADDFAIDLTCVTCGSTFDIFSAYCEHMEVIHDNVNLEKFCPVCDRNLKTWYHLGRHMRTHMPKEARFPIKCPECDNRFSTTAQMEVHINHKHRNPKPFVCEVCGFCGATKHNLTQHMYKHNGNAPFECEVCKRKFSLKRDLNIHMDIHGPNKYVCTICGKQLNSRATLRNHFFVHSDNKQHKCDYCGTSFKQSKALKAHLILHTGLKPYYCSFCDHSFSNRTCCRIHMKKKHPVELASMEASGNKAYTKNVPKLETLKELAKTADNLIAIEKHGSSGDLTCFFCERRFRHRAARNVHMNNKHPEEIAAKRALKLKTKKSALKSSKSAQITCEFCNRKFGHLKLYQNHMKLIHHDEIATIEGSTKIAAQTEYKTEITEAADSIKTSAATMSECFEDKLQSIDGLALPCSSDSPIANIQDLFILME